MMRIYRASAAPPCPSLAVILLALLVVAGACRGRGATPMATGEWTGDMHAPELPAAIGFLARVTESPAAMEIVSLGAMGFSGGKVAELRTTGDSLSFVWTSEGNRDCRLARDASGRFGGVCTHQSDTPWKVRLVPPALRREAVGYARSALANASYQWNTREERWGRLHVPASMVDSIDPEQRARAIDSARASGIALLGASQYDRALDAFLVEGRRDIAALMGQPHGSTADAFGSTVLLAGLGSMPTVMRHEVMHVLSMNLWGVPVEPAAWAREGLATYAGGNCGGYGLHQLAASLAATGELLPMRALLDDFHRQPDLASYLESGSIVQHLYETYGRAFMRDVWQSGLEPVLRRDGRSLESLESEWRARLARADVRSAEVDWSRIRGKGCG